MGVIGYVVKLSESTSVFLACCVGDFPLVRRAWKEKRG